nr:unnamed protein product [Digitaria exilis]
MHRLSLTVIEAAAAMPAGLRLGTSPALRLAAASRHGLRPPRLLRFGGPGVGGARRGMLCSAEAARRGEDAEAEEAPRGGGSRAAAVERRMRGGSAAAAAVGTSVELLAIPGVGPRNLRKLVDNGFEGVAQLKQLYRDKFFGKSTEQMVEFLQSSVGIVHKNHAESITSFIKESVDEELKDTDSSRPTQKKRLTFCVEGNISVGKSTFLQRIANETIELRDLVEIVPEPVNKWQDVGPDHFNILDAFYAEPHRYAYTFQNYVFVTRVMQERESQAGIKPLRLMERSVFSDRMVFVRAVHEANWMNEMEISIYDSWFDPVVSSLPGLHEKHESWLLPSKGSGPGVLSVPALVLDCEPDIDFNKDIEAKQQYARQVAEFFEFVKKKKEEAPSDQTSADKDRMNPQVMLPNRGRLWVPEGNPFAGSPMNLDFRRAMSSYIST